MKQRFNILNDPRFNLVYNEKRRFSIAPNPSRIRLNRENFILMPDIKKKKAVYPGMLLATHPSEEKGDLHSPIFGEITDINHRSIFIEAREAPEDFDESQIQSIDLLKEGYEGDELAMIVKQIGVNTRSLGKKAKVLIINGLNPEPGVTWAEPMLTVHVRNLRAGMELHKRLRRADDVILAVPKGSSVSHDGVKIAYVEPEYPNSINELLIKEITGEENPPGVAVVGLHNIWSLGRVGVTKQPLQETVITIGTRTHWSNYIVKNGSTVGELIDFAGVKLQQGDTILRGGPLRGESLDKLNRSLTKGAYGLFVVEKGTIPPMQGHSPCINCGACIQVCPARIDPSMLSRYSEFARYDSCLKGNIFSCVDCGLCGYVCIARRPVMQYIRLAKDKLRGQAESNIL